MAFAVAGTAGSIESSALAGCEVAEEAAAERWLAFERWLTSASWC